MSALSTLFPVFFMIILGMIARIKNFISPKQKGGANHIVFNNSLVLVFPDVFLATSTGIIIKAITVPAIS